MKSKSREIVSHPKSKRSWPSPVKGVSRSQQRTTTSGRYVDVKRDKGSGYTYTELPPGPPNYIVRTPYPVAPSEDDTPSE